MKYGILLPLSALLLGAPAAAQDNRAAEANAAFVSYPKASLEAGEQGIVHYKVVIGRRGRVDECEVTRSSGFERLDLATCNLLIERGQFTPTSRKRRSTYEGRVHWRLS